jgi:hypothetical protein
LFEANIDLFPDKIILLLEGLAVLFFKTENTESTKQRLKIRNNELIILDFGTNSLPKNA